MTDTLLVKRLRGATPPGRKKAIDQILERARRALVSAGEHLPSAEERALDADGDRDRIVLYATLEGRTVGVVDATLHAPGPGDLTIAQLAVAEAARGRGVGRRLVQAAVDRAALRLGDVEATVHAAVLPRNVGALAFWERLGFEISEDGPTVVLSRSLASLRASLGPDAA